MKQVIFLQKALLAAAIILGFSGAAHSQELSPEIKAQIDSAFQQWNSINTPGAALAVIKDNRVLYQRTYGMADLARRKPLTPDHQFWVASLTKQFTAMSIALLAEAGKLHLKDDIRKYLPELPFLGDTVRIKHLLYHTSGLRDGFTLIGLTFKGERHYTNQNVIKKLRQQQHLNFKPGDCFEYNNGGYVLLAEIAARVSGQPFPELVETSIFRPLGMKDSRISGQVTYNIPRLAKGYGVSYKSHRPKYTPRHFKGNSYGSTGLITTLADLAKWNANLEHNILGAGKPNLSEQVLTVGTLNNGRATKYAFGLEVADYNGKLATSHSGADPGYKAEMVRFPEQKVTVICLANTDDAYGLTSLLLQMGDWIIQNKTDKAELPAASTSPADLVTLTGYYLNVENNYQLQLISQQAGKLYTAQSLQGYKAPLVAGAGGIFWNEGRKEYALRFQTSETDREFLTYSNPREGEYTLQKVRPVVLTPGQLKAFAGKYYSPVLQQHYRLSVRKGKLGLKVFGIIHIPFQPLEGNRFLADLMGNNCLIFTTDQANQVTGFTFNRAAISNLRFEKVK